MMRKRKTDPVYMNSKINADDKLIRKKFDYLGRIALLRVITTDEDVDKVKDEVTDSLLALRNMWIPNGKTQHKKKN